uniref:palmitoyl-CoA hydrolase n=1 Tax=Nothoprocta perdicaria TaxID=30464 RepID=A0A8C6ZSX8_NOTPE
TGAPSWTPVPLPWLLDPSRTPGPLLGPWAPPARLGPSGHWGPHRHVGPQVRSPWPGRLGPPLSSPGSRRPQSHPGTNVTVVDLFDRGQSLRPLWLQVEGFRRAVAPIMANAASGVHLLCYSQGAGVVLGARFGANSGVFGADPHHRELYLNSSDFLAVLNDERLNPNASGERPYGEPWGAYGGPIAPMGSPGALFAFYDANETVREMREQAVYVRDTFGLRTLDARGAIGGCSVPGVAHTRWHSDRAVYQACIRPWLT